MFKPNFTVSPHLLANIKRIAQLVTELNNRHFPEIVLLDLERKARAVSAHSSTSIEGNPLPLTEVKRIMKYAPEHVRDSEREVLNYNQALDYLNKLLKEKSYSFDLKLILSTQKMVTANLISKSKSGHLRQEPVFVNNPLTRKPIYFPPDHSDVQRLMQELVGYVNSNKGKLDPLIVAGLFHKQFVIIHPFIDGNGRTARLATKMLLARMGLDTFNLFSFENYYNQNVTKYFEMVGLVGNYYDLKDKVDFTPWLEYFTEGIIDELLRVQKLLPEVSLSPETKLQPYHLKILEFIREKGFITGSDYAKLSGRAKATRTKDFKRLIDLGLIERKGRGKATYYVLK